jgi:hypothetical protein
MKIFLTLTMLLAAFTMATPDLEPILVSDFDREEIMAIHDAAQTLIDRRNILISHTAKRHSVNLLEYDYDIEKGIFFAKDITSPDISSGSNPP